ncbi:hypothetical protein Tco_0692505 [Tanacetum coccineum]|uniref:Uncharacterized protein n=1 Tax=Tanacetum coccineum TaxID=301880 RepID=A0ABQ5J976_9ASTR
MVYVHSATGVASHLVAYTRERKGGYFWPSAAKSISNVCSAYHQWYQVHHGEHISSSYPFRMEGFGASGSGRTTSKKKVRSSHSFYQNEGSACIVPDKRITEHAHEVKAIGCDTKLLGENQGWSLSKNNEV